MTHPISKFSRKQIASKKVKAFGYKKKENIEARDSKIRYKLRRHEVAEKETDDEIRTHLGIKFVDPPA